LDVDALIPSSGRPTTSTEQSRRDSYNDAGATINATVRYCPSVTNCPWSNAQWTGSRIRFGNGFTTDDVAGHEFTHAVTEFTSGLVYKNTSGAINESLSDVFGEFVDLESGSNDNAGVRWQMGGPPNGRIRDASDPPDAGDPTASAVLRAVRSESAKSTTGGPQQQATSSVICLPTATRSTINRVWHTSGVAIFYYRPMLICSRPVQTGTTCLRRCGGCGQPGLERGPEKQPISSLSRRGDRFAQ
jgi:hypothetical protein